MTNVELVVASLTFYLLYMREKPFLRISHWAEILVITVSQLTIPRFLLVIFGFLVSGITKRVFSGYYHFSINYASVFASYLRISSFRDNKTS
ncbi:hypothetical protein Glove_123g193 [Diversispora epigaea]|uniref:Uncharacterized protein n=1 Tax=Diversispora epigaea TaxID=1348612 RepID=A0A397J2L5_9GLOM|nr:hypothetical protein Glove_123g193 [Diversispora epigaea]